MPNRTSCRLKWPGGNFRSLAGPEMEQRGLLVDFNQARLAASLPAIRSLVSILKSVRDIEAFANRSGNYTDEPWYRRVSSRAWKAGSAPVNCRILPVDSKHFVGGFSRTVSRYTIPDRYHRRCEKIARYWIFSRHCTGERSSRHFFVENKQAREKRSLSRDAGRVYFAKMGRRCAAKYSSCSRCHVSLNRRVGF